MRSRRMARVFVMMAIAYIDGNGKAMRLMRVFGGRVNASFRLPHFMPITRDTLGHPPRRRRWKRCVCMMPPIVIYKRA